MTDAANNLGDGAIPMLAKLLNDPSEDVRSSLAGILVTLGTKAIPQIQEASQDSSPSVREALIDAIADEKQAGKSTDPAEMTLLLSLEHDRDTDVRAKAAQAVSCIKTGSCDGL
jgi:HEAT repeat protein